MNGNRPFVRALLQTGSQSSMDLLFHLLSLYCSDSGPNYRLIFPPTFLHPCEFRASPHHLLAMLFFMSIFLALKVNYHLHTVSLPFNKAVQYYP